MYKKVLVVNPDLEWWKIIVETLEAACTGDDYQIVPSWAKSQKEAEGFIEENFTTKHLYDLVITHLDVPYDIRHPLPAGRKEKPGLQLVQRLRQKDIDVPVVIVAVDADKYLYREVNSLSCTELAFEGEELEEDLSRESKRWLSTEGIVQKEKRVDLDITLDLEKRECLWGLHGRGFAFEDAGKVPIDSDELGTLIKKSQDIAKLVKESADSDIWEHMLCEIGQGLAKQIFESDSDFAHEFFEKCGAAGGIDHSRIRFTVEEKLHPLVLEALKEKKRDYWMLQAPVYRRLQIFGDQYALFQDEETRKGPLNCLIIQANVFGSVDGYSLEELKNVKEEAVWLEDYLNEHQDKFHIGKVSRICMATAEHSFRDAVQHTLESGEVWHIVHYAGHSVYDADKGGYIFFPGKSGAGSVEERMVQKVNIMQFALWLRRAQVRFVNLSSCHSSEADFVFHLAEQHVPAVAGFRWNVDDEKAKEYTKAFYTRLLEGKKSLEYAFLEARQDMRGKYRTNPIWAAPVLVMQVAD